MSSRGIRRRPTLPGRFQPSTISVLRLNFCVRDGNRWIPQASVTGKERGSRLLLPRVLLTSGRPTNGLPTVLGCARFPSVHPVSHLCFPAFPSVRSQLRLRTLRTAQGGVHFRLSMTSALSVDTLTFPSVSSRSRPRPISIIKLHTLPHFHR